MARQAADDDNGEKPLDPEVEKVRRKLVRFVAINLGLLFVALMAVLGAIVYKSRTPAEPAAEAGMGNDLRAAGGVIDGEIGLPAGTRIISQSLSGNRIAIDAELADGSRTIFVYDMAQRRLIGRLAIKAE